MLSEEKIALSKVRLDTAKERIRYAQEIIRIGDYKKYEDNKEASD